MITFTGEKDAIAALNGCYAYIEDVTWVHYIDCGSDNAFDPYPWEGYMELALEGLRFYDIQRWRIGEDVLSGPVYGSRLGTVDRVTGKVTYTTPDHILNETRVFNPAKNYLWPIPQREIDINPNLIQNPNY